MGNKTGNGDQNNVSPPPPKEDAVDLTKVSAILYSPDRKRARVFGPEGTHIDIDDIDSVIIMDEVEVFNFSFTAAGGIGSFSDEPTPDSIMHVCFSQHMKLTQEESTLNLAKTDPE